MLALAACAQAPPREITELVVQDSTYLDPETMLPYSGPVFRNFPADEGGTQFEATLRDGTWEGELTIYHETGRVRYEGEMSGGAQCGAWIENENPVESESIYEAIKEDLESLVIYPDLTWPPELSAVPGPKLDLAANGSCRCRVPHTA